MDVEHVDVLIVGAGLSGIGAAYHLQAECPSKTYAIFEAREAIGGTWDLFRYPGVRSDSDMYTLGYRFRPWSDPKAIADGPSILSYIRETALENGIDRRIRFGHRVARADWSSERVRWMVQARTARGQTVSVSCDFLYVCSGYYRYDEGYTPAFPGREAFAGRIVHPQKWTEDVDYDDKRVLVIGSGATAVTMVPALARRAAHVIMLQRSPSYIVSLSSQDPVADLARRFLPSRLAYTVIRWKNVLLMLLSFQLARRRPELVKRMIRRGVERQLPPGFDVERHFTPPYNPWEQRLCLVSDGNLFRALSDGSASIVTGHIETFTERGVRLRDGEEIEADLIVTATGLNLLPLGGLSVRVDGRPIELSKTVSYKGMMVCGVPNLAVAFGYTNASWTLKCDLTSEYVCRLLNHMDERRFNWCVAREPGQSVRREPFIDFNSGYVARAIDGFPKQGSRVPWRLHQNYALDIMALRFGALEDGAIEFGHRTREAQPSEPLAA